MRLIGMAGRRVGFNDCVGNELLGGGGKMVGQRDTQIQMVVYKNGASYLLLPSVTPTPRGRTAMDGRGYKPGVVQKWWDSEVPTHCIKNGAS